MIDRASTLERVSSAMNGSDSSDYLAALALAQVGAGRVGAGASKLLRGVVDAGVGMEAAVSAVGAKLTRLQTTTSQMTYNQARDALAGLVRKLNSARRWKLEDKHVVRVAESTLLMHLHPTCPYCNGMQREDAVTACVRCDGTGNRPLPKRNGAEVGYVLNVLAMIQGLTERAVARRMG